MIARQQAPSPPSPPSAPSPQAPAPGGQTVITTDPDGRVTIHTSETPTTGVLAPQSELPVPPPWVTLPPPVIALVSLGALAAAAIVFLPLMRAIARRIEGRSPAEVAGRHELEELRDRVAALEQQQSQLHELEERLDFAERLLAAKKDVPQVRP